MKRLIQILIITTLLIACSSGSKQVSFNSKAIELNDQATQLQITNQDSALVLYDMAIKLDTNYYLPHSNKIGIYLNKKDFDKALFESEMVIKKKPDLAEGWVFAGMLNEWLGDTIKAMNYYRKSIEIFENRISNPDKKDNILINKINRAFSIILLGQEKQGKEELLELKDDNPENPYNIMIDEFLKTNKKDYMNEIFGSN